MNNRAHTTERRLAPSIAATIEALTERINSLTAADEGAAGLRVTVEQVKQIVAALGVDDDLRITFNFTVMRAAARHAGRAPTIDKEPPP